MRLLLKSGLERVAKTASGYQHKHEWGGGGYTVAKMLRDFT